MRPRRRRRARARCTSTRGSSSRRSTAAARGPRTSRAAWRRGAPATARRPISPGGRGLRQRQVGKRRHGGDRRRHDEDRGGAREAARAADATEGHHHRREQRHERQVDGAERLEQRGEHEAGPGERPAAAHGALGGEEHERQVHRRVQLEVSELRRPPGREAEEEAAEGAGHDAARPRPQRHVHRERREREGEQEDGLMREERVPGRELERRRERQVADEVVGARQRAGRGPEDVRVEEAEGRVRSACRSHARAHTTSRMSAWASHPNGPCIATVSTTWSGRCAASGHVHHTDSAP
jgi:hypothetical protein